MQIDQQYDIVVKTVMQIDRQYVIVAQQCLNQPTYDVAVDCKIVSDAELLQERMILITRMNDPTCYSSV